MPFHTHAMGQFGIVFAILGGLSWLAIVAGIVLLVIWAARTLTSHPVMRTSPAAATAAESPLDILARRFAMGEITPDEFERSRSLLRGQPPTAPSPPPPSG